MAEKKHGEFEREPVPDSAKKGLKAFVGMYAGEHCAGAELMIGPLFVAAWGYDMVSKVANIAAPWMVLVFLGFVALYGLILMPMGSEKENAQ